MDFQDNVHVTFAQLTPELRAFYSLAATAAMRHLSPYLEAIQVPVGNISLSRIWDDYQFTPADTVDFLHDPERLELYLVHFVVKDPEFWCPRLAA